jgi:glutamyl-tRNA synthetase
VGDYQHQGFLPEAMLNFLALLGWSTGDEVEVLSLDELVQRFDVKNLHAKAAVFDTKKLEWMNGQHLARTDINELARIVAPLVEKAGLATVAELEAKQAWFCGVLELLRIRARLTDEIVAQSALFFTDGVEYDAEAVSKQWRDAAATADVLEATHERLAALATWETTAMEDALRALAEQRGISGGKIFQPLRVALTGLTVSPGIFDVLLYVGRERSLRRIKAAVEYLRAPV